MVDSEQNAAMAAMSSSAIGDVTVVTGENGLCQDGGEKGVNDGLYAIDKLSRTRRAGRDASEADAGLREVVARFGQRPIGERREPRQHLEDGHG